MKHTSNHTILSNTVIGFTILCLLVNNQQVIGQKRTISTTSKRVELEAAKRANLQKIQQLNSIIEKTEQSKEASLGKVNALGERIVKQNKQISLLTENQHLLNQEIVDLQKASGELSGNLEKLKAEYASMIYNSAKVSTQFNKLSFLFSSADFNQLVRRYQYLKQYSESREKQAVLIQKTRAELLAEQQKILQRRQEQAAVLKEKVNQIDNLESLKQKHSDLVTQLSTKEQQLKVQLETKKKSVSNLDRMIAQVVEREIKRSQLREQRAKSALEKGSQNKVITQKENQAISMNAEENKLASSFASLKGRMAWPVSSGFISDHFGVHNHPILKRIKLNNNGVDIQTGAGKDVSVVYNGIVQSVVSIPGVNMMVAVQHGDYFTVYSKLSNVTVSNGQAIKAGQKIGVVATDSDGTSEMNFQVWKNTSKQNPEQWLRGR